MKMTQTLHETYCFDIDERLLAYHHMHSCTTCSAATASAQSFAPLHWPWRRHCRHKHSDLKENLERCYGRAVQRLVARRLFQPRLVQLLLQVALRMHDFSPECLAGLG